MKIKKKLVTLAVTAALCVSGVVGVVGADGNVEDRAWEFYHQNSTLYTISRIKENNTNVYVYPKLGQTLKYMVQVNESNGYVDARSTYASIPVKTQATLRSEAGTDDSTRVKMVNEHINYGYTSGVWSPDSTQYYTVY